MIAAILAVAGLARGGRRPRPRPRRGVVQQTHVRRRPHDPALDREPHLRGAAGRLASARVTRNGSGNLVKSSRLDPTNAARAVATLRRPGAKWWPATYKVIWKVVAADGHAQTITITFRVRR